MFECKFLNQSKLLWCFFHILFHIKIDSPCKQEWAGPRPALIIINHAIKYIINGASE